MKDKQEEKGRNNQNHRDQLKNIARYSGLGFQILAALLLGFWLGNTIDGWLNMRIPVFTISLFLLFFVAVMVYIIRNLPK